MAASYMWFWVWSPFHCGCCKVFHKFVVVVVQFYLILFYLILGDSFRFLFLFWFWICCCFWELNLFFVDSFVLCFCWVLVLAVVGNLQVSFYLCFWKVGFVEEHSFFV